jgi:hypothetical protein
MIVVTTQADYDQSIRSFNTELEPAKPLCVIEIVSEGSSRKDYKENVGKYGELQVRYYLLYEPEKCKLVLYVHDGEKYVEASENQQGRLALPELELEAGISGRWMRLWYQGELLPTTLEEHDRAEEERRNTLAERRRAEVADRRAEEARQRAEEARQRAEAERQRAEAERQRAEAERQRAEEADRRAEEARQRAEEQARMVEELQRRLQDLTKTTTPKPNGSS